MKAFYILKPDGLDRKEVLKTYKQIITSQDYIKNREQFIIDSWVDLSCLLYEIQDEKLDINEKQNLRKKLLTTIKCYDYLYKDKNAIIDIFDIPDNDKLIELLSQIKYDIRNEHVINSKKNYIKFLNLSQDELVKQFKNIDIRNLDILHFKTECNVNFTGSGYNLAYMNCIHFPDPTKESIERDLEIITNNVALTKKIHL